MLKILAALAAIVLLVGCSGMELTERGFVLGAALDLAEDDRIALTTQMYKPGKTDVETRKTRTFFNVATTGVSVFDAVREIPLHLGRKAQWGHMQIVVVGEELAKSSKLLESLDFFFRDDEPRMTSRIVVADGKADAYLRKVPYIEKSVSRLLRNLQRSSSRFSGKTPDVTLLELKVAVESETGTIVVPFVKNKKDETPMLQGGAVLKNGRMVGRLSPDEVLYNLMLRGELRSCVIPVPCGRDSKALSESVELLGVKSRIKPVIAGDDLSVKVMLSIQGTIREITCSKVLTERDSAEYGRKVAGIIESGLNAAIRSYKRMKADTIGIGNEVFKTDPRKWRQWKRNWDNRFAQIHYDFDIRMNIVNVGLESGEAFNAK